MEGTEQKRGKRFGNSLAIRIEGGKEERRVATEKERGQDRREVGVGKSKGVNYEVTNVESAEWLVAKHSCKNMHSIEVMQNKIGMKR